MNQAPFVQLCLTALALSLPDTGLPQDIQADKAAIVASVKGGLSSETTCAKPNAGWAQCASSWLQTSSRPRRFELDGRTAGLLLESKAVLRENGCAQHLI